MGPHGPRDFVCEKCKTCDEYVAASDNPQLCKSCGCNLIYHLADGEDYQDLADEDYKEWNDEDQEIANELGDGDDDDDDGGDEEGGGDAEDKDD